MTDPKTSTRAAPEVAKAAGKAAGDETSPAHVQRLLHELQLRQIDLQVQNQELRNLRARAEAAAKRYTQLYGFAPIGYLTLDPDGHITELNLAAARLFGSERARLVGKRLGQFIASPYQQVVVDFVRHVFEGRGQLSCEARLIVGQDRYRCVRLDATASHDGFDCQIALIDITDRKRAEQAEADLVTTLEQRVQDRTSELREAVGALTLSEARLRGIFDSTTDAILTVDGAHRIVEANLAAINMFRPSVALIGAPLVSLLPARYRLQHEQHMEAFSTGADSARQMGASQELLGLRADGEEFPIEASISQIRVRDERLYTVILRDVSARKTAQSDLLASKAKLEAALEGMTDAVLISDAAGRISEVNSAFASFHRFRNKAESPRSLTEYRAILEVFHGDGRAAPLDQWPLQRALRGETASSVEYNLRRKDTGETWVGSYSFGPLRDAADNIVGSVVTARDVTHYKRVQTELQTTQTDLRQLLAAQDRVQERERMRIARDLHDDLQQTLSAIKLEVMTAKERLAADTAQALTILDDVGRLATSAITSTRRIVNGLRPQLLDDLGLVAALEALAQQVSQQRAMACTFDAPWADDESFGVHAEAAICIYRVAQEALNNVIKHAQASVVTICLDVVCDGQMIRLRIQDDGKGIQPQDRRKRDSLGLIGMSERARSVGGTLEIRNEASRGTTLELRVPR